MTAPPGDALALTRALVSIDSRNPAFAQDAPGEGAVAHILADTLSAWGFTVDLLDAAPGRPNVLARIGGGHGLFCFLGAQVGDLRQQVAGAGVVDIETARACDPLPIDQCISFEKAGIFQQ